MTRTNLIGMGIVCGLQVKTEPDGSSITITKGVGVTSSGYLVTVPEIEYTEYKSYDPVKCVYYDRFVNIGSKTALLDLWELKQDASEEGTTPLDNTFLSGKIVLIFVELLEENNKNCDPDSCDDKGTKVTVTFRPLLADKDDVDALLSNASNSAATGSAVLLPQTKMPRYDVASTLLLDTEDVFEAYQRVLTTSFIPSVQTTLSGAWTKLSSLLTDDFPADPFSSFTAKFAFLNDGTITNSQVLNLQYFYDFFSDLLLAYDELRIKAYDTICECLPDEGLFPRHLLLGEAIGFDEMNSQYRTRFISSPVLCCCADDTRAVKSLFNRIVLMIDNFAIPGIGNGAFNQQTEIKITPSTLGREPLSEKAIPFYYNTNSGTDPLYLNWNIHRTLRGTASQILSYKSNEYNTTDDFVMNPLKYDIEPNNFLRIEGHIGQDYRSVLAQLDTLKRDNRLPFEVVALSSDTRSIFNIIDALTTMDTTGSVTSAFEIMIKNPCCFSDIFLALDQWLNKLLCCLLEQKKYYMALPLAGTKSRDAALNEEKLQDAIFGASSKSHSEKYAYTGYSENTIGALYEEKRKAGTINNQFCTDVFVNIATGSADPASALVMMPFKIDGMIEVLPKHITELDSVALEARYTDLTGTSSQLSTMYASPNIRGTMVGIDNDELASRLEMNCLLCLFLEFVLLIREFLIRLLALMIKQKLGYYAYTNPGIQHKAGVPVGGTFIIVYHEQTEQKTGGIKTNFPSSFENIQGANRSGTLAFSSADQPLLSSVLLLDEFLFLQKVNEVEEEPNQVLDPIVNSIIPGVVIADFYVPYLCCSDCAPAQMLVLPAPETQTSSSCDLPCEGLTDTSQYEWSSNEAFLEELSREGKPYSFSIVEYEIDGQSLLQNGPEEFNISLGDDMTGIDYQMIFEPINVTFPDGLVFTWLEDGVSVRGIPFTIKRFQCHSFKFVVLDTDKPDDKSIRYTYTEKTMFVNDDEYIYEKRINTFVIDECIDTKTSPCGNKKIQCNYQWPDNDTIIRNWLSTGLTYRIRILEYTSGDKIIVSESNPDTHYISQKDGNDFGLALIVKYLDDHYKTNESAVFGFVTKDVINITRYECLNFNFEFEVLEGPQEHKGEIWVYNQNGTFVKNPNGNLETIMPASDCKQG